MCLNCNCALARTLYTLIEAFSMMTTFQLLAKKWCLVHCVFYIVKIASKISKSWEVILNNFLSLKNGKISRFSYMKTYFYFFCAKNIHTKIEDAQKFKLYFRTKNLAFGSLWYSIEIFFWKTVNYWKGLSAFQQTWGGSNSSFYKSWCRVSPAHQFILLTIA